MSINVFEIAPMKQKKWHQPENSPCKKNRKKPIIQNNPPGAEIRIMQAAHKHGEHRHSEIDEKS